MIWYLAILALIILAVYSRRFRRVLLIGTGLLVCAVVYFVYSSHREGQEYERSKNRISLNEVEMADLHLAQRAGSGSYDMVGRITNKSKQYTLKEVRLELTMQDCGAGGCETVGQSTETLATDIPPGQSKEVAVFLSFSSLGKAKGKYQWNYKILFARGD